MSIPLEDLVTDIVGKAQRGLGISDTELANKIGIEISELDAVKQVKDVAFAEVEKLAKALELGPKSLVAIAEGKYTPSVTLPKTGLCETRFTSSRRTRGLPRGALRNPASRRCAR